MQDIAEKMDRLKALIADGAARPVSHDSPEADARLREGVGLALDLVGELVANSRRNAVAMEKLTRAIENRA